MSRPRVIYVQPGGRRREEALVVLQAEPIDLELAEVSGPEGYYQLLRDLWAAADPFVLVEWDNVPYPGAIQEVWDCSHLMCGKPYRIRDMLGAFLGCTKITGQLMREYPDAIIEAGKRPWPADRIYGYGFRHWENLDSRIFCALEDRGYAGQWGAGFPHQHFPVIEHLHEYPNWSGELRPMQPFPQPVLPPSVQIIGSLISLTFNFGFPLTVDGQPAHRQLETSSFSLLAATPVQNERELRGIFSMPEQRGVTLGRLYCQLLDPPARPITLCAGARLADGAYHVSWPLTLP